MKCFNNANFTLPKQSQRSRSILQDGSRSLGLFWKEKNSVLKSKKYGLHVPTCILGSALTEDCLSNRQCVSAVAEESLPGCM